MADGVWRAGWGLDVSFSALFRALARGEEKERWRIDAHTFDDTTLCSRYGVLPPRDKCQLPPLPNQPSIIRLFTQLVVLPPARIFIEPLFLPNVFSQVQHRDINVSRRRALVSRSRRKKVDTLLTLPNQFPRDPLIAEAEPLRPILAKPQDASLPQPHPLPRGIPLLPALGQREPRRHVAGIRPVARQLRRVQQEREVRQVCAVG